jgi:uncharacterized membrane protein YfcA
VALCVSVVLSALTMPAGIGGGILFVPVLRLIGGMTQSESSSLSQVLITGASIGSIMFQVYWQCKHPKEALLAQPYFVVIAMPALLSGSLVGVYLNNVLPSFISLVVLVILCIVSSYVIFKKGIECYRKEDEARVIKQSPRIGLTQRLDEPPSLVPITDIERQISWMSIEAGLNVATSMIEEVDPIEEPAQSYLYDDSRASSLVSISSYRRAQRIASEIASQRRISSLDSTGGSVRGESAFAPSILGDADDLEKRKATKSLRCIIRTVGTFVSFVVIYWILLVVFTLLRGSEKNPSFSGIQPCGSVYWVVTAIQAAMGITFALLVAPREFKMIIGTFGAGIVATVTGASGGIMLNPMFLSMGLDPQQVAATSTIIMLIMASCSALEFLIAGKIEPILTTMLFATLAGAIVGMTGVSWIVKKSGRQSILVFLLGALVVAGGAMLIYIGIADLIQTISDGGNPFELGQLC